VIKSNQSQGKSKNEPKSQFFSFPCPPSQAMLLL
jgi:hypothetical protein